MAVNNFFILTSALVSVGSAEKQGLELEVSNPFGIVTAFAVRDRQFADDIFRVAGIHMIAAGTVAGFTPQVLQQRRFFYRDETARLAVTGGVTL
jgi:hypothetical protein